MNDNANQIPFDSSGHDRLFKVRKLLDLAVPLFKSKYVMHQECTIDEAMIPFRFQTVYQEQTNKVGHQGFCLG